MKATRIFIVMVAVILTMVWSHAIFAEEKSITLPKGTKVEKLGVGHFKFKLPDGQIVEVKGFTRSGTAAIIGDSGIYDRSGKLILAGKEGVLKSGPKPKEFIKENTDYIKIDDEPTWLPATITVKVRTKTKGLSPQPDPPGKIF